MLKKDIASFLNALFRHGIKPPCDMQDKEAKQSLVDEYFDKLQSLTDEEFHKIVEKAPLIPHWPTIAELEELVADHRRENMSQQFGGKRQGAIKRDQECEAALGHKLPLGASWLDELAKKAAKRWCPEASKEFVFENRLVLAAQCEKDYICDSCYGKTLHECKTGGHQAFLKVDPYSGLCIECVDCEQCSKVIIPASDDKEERKNGRRQEG